MRTYAKPGAISEDPLDGPHPTKKTKYKGTDDRGRHQRQTRHLKKGARQNARIDIDNSIQDIEDDGDPSPKF